MKTAYEKVYLNAILIVGFGLFGWFSFEFFSTKWPNWMNYGQLVCSILILWYYLYRIKHKYLKIENGELKVISPTEKKIRLRDIKKIKKLAGDYILKTDKKKLIINISSIDPKSLFKLNKELKKLNLEWE